MPTKIEWTATALDGQVWSQYPAECEREGEQR